MGNILVVILFFLLYLNSSRIVEFDPVYFYDITEQYVQ